MNQLRQYLHEAILLVIGNFILAVGVAFFIIPNKILSGGVAGAAIALQPITKMPVQLTMNIIIAVTFVMGFLFLGKGFAIKTVASSILYPIFVNMLGAMDFTAQVDPMLASIFGGIITGAGLGLTFKTGSSTGGMDIPPLILEKYTGIRVSIWIFVIDAFTVLLGLKSYSLNEVLIGFLSIYAATKTIDTISMLGGEQARQVTIISDKYEEILNHLHSSMQRGSTLLKARGGYTRDNKEIILTVITKKQYFELEKEVLQVDPDAFLIVSNVTEVHGLGFRKP